jgi:hypothetical protein
MVKDAMTQASLGVTSETMAMVMVIQDRTAAISYLAPLAMCSLMGASVWVGLLSVRVAGMTTVSRILLLMMIQEEVIQVVVMVVVLASSPPMLLTRCRLA